MDPATFKLTGWRLVQPINFTRPKGGRRDFRHSAEVVAASTSEQTSIGRLQHACGNLVVGRRATSVQGKLLGFDCFPQHAPVA